MTVYINGAQRDDIVPQIGGKVSQTSAHKTSSTLSVSVPVGSTDLQECDYIKIVDSDITVLAGTILGIDQQDAGTATDQLTERFYDLTISSNADFIASVYTDMQFPAGASVTQIILGNHPAQDWYSAGLGEFCGVFEIRIAAEGITLGAVDDFTNLTLAETACLWGMYVSDLLDSLCDTADAWWEITADKIFNMRYNISRSDAPFSLTKDAPAYDIEPSQDAYTMYSAVRVTGGQAPGNMVYADLSGPDKGSHTANATYVSNKKITLAYPIADLEEGSQYHGLYVYDPVTYASNFGYYNPRIGFHGIDESNPDVDVLITYGSPDIDAVNNFTFPDMTGSNEIYVPYIPLVKIFVRLQIDELVNEIKSQRGGTGIIETTVNDDTITSFADAAAAGTDYLKNNAKRAKNVKFKTMVSGFTPGQILRDNNIPYYSISGDYLVGAVTASIIYPNNDGSPCWEYAVEASNINYRDKAKALFYAQQRVQFKIGSDAPAADGRFAQNEISVESSVTFAIYIVPTWSQLDARGLTWGQLDAAGQTWDQTNGLTEVWTVVANLLTQACKNQIAAFLINDSPDSGAVQMMNIRPRYDGDGDTGRIVAVAQPIRSNNEITTVFYMDDQTACENLTGFDFDNGPDKQAQGDPEPITNAHIDVSIDKSSTNPRGPFTLTVTKVDTVI